MLNRPQPDRIQKLALEIDAYFDKLLYEGMPIEEAMEIERRRDVAHAKLMEMAIQRC